MRWSGHVVCIGKRKGAYNVFLGKPVGKKPLGSPRRRQEDNIKMDLQEEVWGHGLNLSGPE